LLDSARAPLRGARITATPEGQAAASSTVSGQDGEFTLAVEPGAYTLRIRAEGFQELSQRADPSSNQHFPEFILQVAPHHDTVTVTESPGYQVAAIDSGTKTLTPLRDVPQSITVVTRELIQDQMMMSIGDVVRYVPGITAIQERTTATRSSSEGTVRPPTSS